MPRQGHLTLQKTCCQGRHYELESQPLQLGNWYFYSISICSFCGPLLDLLAQKEMPLPKIVNIAVTTKKRTAKKANGFARCAPDLPATNADDHNKTNSIGRKNVVIAAH